jgi:hypothetical protein
VVGYNDHLREESHNHYILAMKKVAAGFPPSSSEKPQASAQAKSMRLFAPPLSDAISLQAKERRPIALGLSS